MRYWKVKEEEVLQWIWIFRAKSASQAIGFGGYIYGVSNYLVYSSTKSIGCCIDTLDSINSVLEVSIPKKV